jgi:hypothetical protein
VKPCYRGHRLAAQPLHQPGRMPTTSSHHDTEHSSLPAHEVHYGGAAGQAHNEAAFRFFLNIERRRAARAAQSVLLVLVRRRVAAGWSGEIDSATAAGIFSALGDSVREADFIGWYRQDSVAGAVLIQQAAPPSDIRRLVTSRVTAALRAGRLEGKMGFRVSAISLSRNNKGLK